MTRSTRMLLALGFGAVMLAPAGAQQPTADDLRAQIKLLPASTFAKANGGVRGMSLAVSIKMDPRLRNLVDAQRGGGDVRSRSLELGAVGAALRVPVTANASDASRAASLAQEVTALGGEVWATFDTTVWAAMSPQAIDRLAASANLHYLTVQETLAPTQVGGSAGSGLDSLRATKVEALVKQGLRGRGVKVGIIDFGYQNYQRLKQAGLVPEPKATRTFPSTQTFESNTQHGSACAEIIHAMAPDADLYLASVNGSAGAFVAAGRWLVSQGVDIISFSGGGTTGPSDGQGDMDRLIDETSEQNNVLWVVSAGNEGSRHWQGTNEDKDKDGLVDEGIVDFLAVADEVSVSVRWNDWGSDSRRPRSTEDVDAFLFTTGEDGKPVLLAKSIDDQNGNGPPVEQLSIKGKGLAGRKLTLALRNARTTRPLDIHAFVEGGRMLVARPGGSIASPASAQTAVAVGAWDASTNVIANYSSQGPTDDNRLKPEIAAPAGLQSAAYGGGLFHGTSAACPHVSGFAALIKAAKPQLSGKALRSVVIQAVEPKGRPVPNMASGYGWIDGSRITGLTGTPPSIGTPPSTRPSPGPPEDTAPAPGRPAAPGAGKRITLPVAWGGSVSSQFLDRVRMPAGEAREFLTRVTTGRDLYRFGDGLKVGFKSSEQCDYLLFHRSSAGEYTLLSPRDGVVASLSPGAPYLLPADTETFEVAPPAGVEELVLLCARRAMDLSGAATARPPAGLAVARHEYQVIQ